MPDKAKIFQYVAMALFGILALLGVMALAMCWGCEEDATVSMSPTTIWGPSLGDGAIQNLFREERNAGNTTLSKTTYVEKNPDTLYSELLEALALGKGPDAVLLDASMLLPLSDKLSVRTYATYPLLDFQQNYVQGAEVFAQENGIYAYPLAVDPLVLYYNRDLFTNAGIAQVPQDWTTFLNVVPQLTIKKGGADIVQSAVAFGEYENILHAREILSSLLFQTGASIVRREGGRYVTDLATVGEGKGTPSVAVEYYAAFANPRKDVYTWNKTFERSREAFAANKVAMYVGFASEREMLEKINPNLNFATAVLPQSATGKNRATYGTYYGIAVLKTSKNQVAAHQVAQALAGKAYAKKIQDIVGLPTVRRDSLAEVPTDPFMTIAIRSALIARDWVQPDPKGVDTSFRLMMETIANGADAASALGTVAADVQTMLARYNKGI